MCCANDSQVRDMARVHYPMPGNLIDLKLSEKLPYAVPLNKKIKYKLA